MAKFSTESGVAEICMRLGLRRYPHSWRGRCPACDYIGASSVRARDIATLIAGGDPSATPQVHPLRWPGPWNRKADLPVMATIIEENPAAIDLPEALPSLENADQAIGIGMPRNAQHLVTADTTPAELAQIAEWLRYYPPSFIHSEPAERSKTAKFTG